MPRTFFRKQLKLTRWAWSLFAADFWHVSFTFEGVNDDNNNDVRLNESEWQGHVNGHQATKKYPA